MQGNLCSDDIEDLLQFGRWNNDTCYVKNGNTFCFYKESIFFLKKYAKVYIDKMIWYIYLKIIQWEDGV